MSFSWPAFLKCVDELSARPAGERLAAFWDLETQTDASRQEHMAGAIVVGLATLSDVKEEDQSAVHTVVRTFTEQSGLPAAMRVLIYADLANLSAAGPPTPMAMLAARNAIRILDRGVAWPRETSDWLVKSRHELGEKLGTILRLGGDLAAEDHALKLSDPPASTLIRHDVRRAIMAGHLDTAYATALARQQDLPPGTSEWLEALIARDYRLLKCHRSPEADLEQRLQLWLLATIYPVAGTKPNAIASPAHLGRLSDLSSQPKRVLALLKVTQALHELRSGKATARDFLLSREFDLLWRQVPEPDVALAVLLAASRLASEAPYNDIRDHFDDLYRASSSLWSRGRSEDLLYVMTGGLPLDKNQTVQSSFATSRAGRGLKVSQATLKLLSSIAVAKMQHTLTSDAEKKAAIKAGLSMAAKKFVSEISELRGGLQKLAQFGFVIPSDLPYEWRDEMAKGLVESQAMSPAAVDKALSDAYGDPKTVFQKFDRQPFAYGSIGQVHRAELVSGEDVCVKLRYVGIEAAVRSDFRNIRSLMPLLRAILPNQPLKAMATAWEERVRTECNLLNEATNHDIATQALAGLPVVVPRAHKELCREDVLVTEFVDGQGFFDFLAASHQQDRNAIGVVLWRSLYALLARGYFREDVQPANYLVRGDQLVMLDLGSILKSDGVSSLARHLPFMRAIARGDRQAVASYLVTGTWASDDIATDAARIVIEVLGRPLRGTFAFTEAYAHEVYRTMTVTLSKSLVMPAGSELLLRVFCSLFTMLAMLKAEADWRTALAPELQA